MDENIKKLQESVDSIAQTTAYILENMATKDDLNNSISEVKSEIQDLRLDLKSFRKDTEYSIDELRKDVDDNTESIMHLDKRMDKLENKAFV